MNTRPPRAQGAEVICWGANFAGQTDVPAAGKEYMVSVSTGYAPPHPPPAPPRPRARPGAAGAPGACCCTKLHEAARSCTELHEAA